MKLTVPTQALLRAVKAADGGVIWQGTQSIQEGVLLRTEDDGMTVAATDREAVHVEVFVRCRPEEPGRIVVSPDPLLKILKRAPAAGSVAIATEPDGTDPDGEQIHRLYVTTPATEYVLHARDGAEWQEIPAPGARELRLPADELSAALHRVMYATTADPNRPVLGGAHFIVGDGKLVLEATDTAILARAELPLPDAAGETRAIVPVEVLREVVRFGARDESDATIMLGDTVAQFVVGAATFRARLIGGVFPPCAKVIPERGAGTTVTVDRDALADTLRRVLFVAGKPEYAVTLAPCGSDEMGVSVTDDGDGAAEALAATFAGEWRPIVLSGRYLLDVLERFSADEVTLQTTHPLMPVRIDDEATGTVHVVMPMSQEAR